MHGQHGFVGFVGCRPVAAPSAGQWRRRLHTRRLLTPPADVTAMHCSGLGTTQPPSSLPNILETIRSEHPGKYAATSHAGSCPGMRQLCQVRLGLSLRKKKNKQTNKQ